MKQLEYLALLTEGRSRAAVAWKLVTRRKRPLPLDVAVPGARVYYDPDEWMRLAGLPSHEHDGVADVLFRSGMCHADGTIEPEVETHFKRTVLRQLTSG